MSDYPGRCYDCGSDDLADIGYVWCRDCGREWSYMEYRRMMPGRSLAKQFNAGKTADAVIAKGFETFKRRR